MTPPSYDPSALPPLPWQQAATMVMDGGDGPASVIAEQWLAGRCPEMTCRVIFSPMGLVAADGAISIPGHAPVHAYAQAGIIVQRVDVPAGRDPSTATRMRANHLAFHAYH